MPTPNKGPRLGGSPQHERLILANLATQLLDHGRITTTETKAKRLRPVAEKLITQAKRGSLHSRREVMKTIRDKDVVHRLFADIAPTFATREGGYTRIIKTAPRKGDNAPMAIIELITEETITAQASRTTRRAATQRTAAPAAGSTPAQEAAPAQDSAPDQDSAEVQDNAEVQDSAEVQDTAPVQEKTADDDATLDPDGGDQTSEQTKAASQESQAEGADIAPSGKDEKA